MKILIHKEYLKQELLTLPVLVSSLGIALLYFYLSTLTLNFRLVTETISGHYPLNHKAAVLIALLQGAPALYTPFELFFILLLGFLMGVNTVLIVRSLREGKEKNGAWSFSLGFLGMLATTGCASCGITLLSIVGPSVSLSLLPFQGVALQFVSLGLLTISLIHTLNRRAQGCIITQR